MSGHIYAILKWRIHMHLINIFNYARNKLMRLYNQRHFIHLGKNIFFEGDNGWGGSTKIHCGNNVWFARNTFVGGNNGIINIGNNVHFAYGVIVMSYSSISIGDDVLVGEYTSIRDQEHDFRKGILIREQELKTAPIVIEKNVWIGRGCIIFKGVTIGTGSVVGANSVVKKDIPSYCITAGTPARVIEYLD